VRGATAEDPPPRTPLAFEAPAAQTHESPGGTWFPGGLVGNVWDAVSVTGGACSTPRQPFIPSRCEAGWDAAFLRGCDVLIVMRIVLCWSGDDLLSRALRHSTIGAEEFNGRVRDGIGFRLLAQVTGPAKDNGKFFQWSVDDHDPRTRIMRAMKPIGRLVLVSSTRHRACTPSLSTWSSSTALKGVMVSRWVSRLDAFSGYPVRT
jgi:hypothetical protein